MCNRGGKPHSDKGAGRKPAQVRLLASLSVPASCKPLTHDRDSSTSHSLIMFSGVQINFIIFAVWLKVGDLELSWQPFICSGGDVSMPQTGSADSQGDGDHHGSRRPHRDPVLPLRATAGHRNRKICSAPTKDKADGRDGSLGQ